MGAQKIMVCAVLSVSISHAWADREPAYTEVKTMDGRTYTKDQWEKMSPADRKSATKSGEGKDKADPKAGKQPTLTKLLIGQPIKPPFSATPLGQKLQPDSSDNIQATPTASSPQGGYPGLTRSEGTKGHAGLDDPSPDPDPEVAALTQYLYSGTDTAVPKNETARYTGLREGKVVLAGEAKDNKGQSLGQRVRIEMKTPEGTWTFVSMHHRELLVKEGQKVKNGDPIALGGGVGDQFSSDEAGPAHVHFEIWFDGVKVDPNTGRVLELTPPPRPEKRKATKPSVSSDKPSKPRQGPSLLYKH